MSAASPLCMSAPQSPPEAMSPFTAASVHTPQHRCTQKFTQKRELRCGGWAKCLDQLRLGSPHPTMGSVNRLPPPHREGGTLEGQRVHVRVPWSRDGLMMPSLQLSSPRILPGLPFSTGTSTSSQPPHLSFPVPRPLLSRVLRAPVSYTLHGEDVRCGKSPGRCQEPGSEFSVCH